MSLTKIDHVVLKSLESWTWSEVYRQKTIKVMWKINWKILLYLVLIKNQVTKIIVLSYVERVSDSLKKKKKSKVLKDFWAVEPIRQKLENGNEGKLPIWLNPKLIYCSLFFEALGYVFLLEKASLGWSHIISGVSVESTWPTKCALFFQN